MPYQSAIKGHLRNEVKKIMVQEAQDRKLMYVDKVTQTSKPCQRPEDIGTSWQQLKDGDDVEEIWHCVYGCLEKYDRGRPFSEKQWAMESKAMFRFNIKYESPLDPAKLKNGVPSDQEVKSGDVDFDYRTGGFVGALFCEIKSAEVKKIIGKSKGHHTMKLGIRSEKGTRRARGRKKGDYQPEFVSTRISNGTNGAKGRSPKVGKGNVAAQTTENGSTDTILEKFIELQKQMESLKAENEMLKNVKEVACSRESEDESDMEVR
jgi:hypothetical protein